MTEYKINKNGTFEIEGAKAIALKNDDFNKLVNAKNMIEPTMTMPEESIIEPVIPTHSEVNMETTAVEEVVEPGVNIFDNPVVAPDPVVAEVMTEPVVSESVAPVIETPIIEEVKPIEVSPVINEEVVPEYVAPVSEPINRVDNDTVIIDIQKILSEKNEKIREISSVYDAKVMECVGKLLNMNTQLSTDNDVYADVIDEVVRKAA